MALKLRPSRRGNFNMTGDRLVELGIPFIGYDHHASCYVIEVDIPPALEAVVRADPLIDVAVEGPPALRRSGPVWGSGSELDPVALGAKLRALRAKAGLELAGAAALTAGALSADAIDAIERTGDCTLQHVIALCDAYGASLDQLVGRTVIQGSRRRR
jgi:hypothetical protein